MRKPTDYKPLTVDQQTGLFAQCLPQGRIWNSKRDADSNFYKLLKSLSEEVNALEERIFRLVTQWDVNVTEDLIVEWETAVGIPDECRSVADDIATRRLDILTKLRKIPIITIDDYKELAEAVTGKPAADWDIRPGFDDFPLDPIYLFVLLVTPPVVLSAAFEYPFGSGDQAVSSITSVGTLATATVADTSIMVDSTIVTISGVTNETDYNGNYLISITSGTTFTYTFAGTGGVAALGTMAVNFGIPQIKLDVLAASDQYLLKPDTTFPGYPLAGSFRTDVLNCVFRKVTPANVAIVFD